MGDKDFFLSPDDAMTMGDIDYMRTSKRTRRTFPKTLANKDGFAIENEVSSVEDRNNLYKGGNTNQNTTSQPGITGGYTASQTNSVQPSTPSTASQPSFDTSQSSTEKRRPSDNGMDMFRNMAKNMRGKR